MAEQHIGVVIILSSKESPLRVLLGKRKNSYRAGSYGLPGGRIEVSEQLAQAAQRELLEETGLYAASMTLIGIVKDTQPDQGFDFIHFVFVCSKWNGEVALLEPDKCEGWAWYNLDELPKPLLLGHQAALEIFSQLPHPSDKTLEQRVLEIVS